MILHVRTLCLNLSPVLNFNIIANHKNYEPSETEKLCKSQNQPRDIFLEWYNTIYIITLIAFINSGSVAHIIRNGYSR